MVAAAHGDERNPTHGVDLSSESRDMPGQTSMDVCDTSVPVRGRATVATYPAAYCIHDFHFLSDDTKHRSQCDHLTVTGLGTTYSRISATTGYVQKQLLKTYWEESLLKILLRNFKLRKLFL